MASLSSTCPILTAGAGREAGIYLLLVKGNLLSLQLDLLHFLHLLFLLLSVLLILLSLLLLHELLVLHLSLPLGYVELVPLLGFFKNPKLKMYYGCNVYKLIITSLPLSGA